MTVVGGGGGVGGSPETRCCCAPPDALWLRVGELLEGLGPARRGEHKHALELLLQELSLQQPAADRMKAQLIGHMNTSLRQVLYCRRLLPLPS